MTENGPDVEKVIDKGVSKSEAAYLDLFALHSSRTGSGCALERHKNPTKRDFAVFINEIRLIAYVPFTVLHYK